MMPTIRKEQPPFVRFEYQEYGINEEATKAAGRPVPKVVPFALIMQHGSKDVVEKVAEEWLEQIKTKSFNGLYPPEWSQRFDLQYQQFLKGEELPRDGTPIKTWAALTREQVIRLLALGVSTVEDLAQMPDSGLGTIGLDGRNLRDLARNFIEQGLNAAGTAKKLADLQEKSRQDSETIERLNARLTELEKADKKK